MSIVHVKPNFRSGWGSTSGRKINHPFQLSKKKVYSSSLVRLQSWTPCLPVEYFYKTSNNKDNGTCSHFLSNVAGKPHNQFPVSAYWLDHHDNLPTYYHDITLSWLTEVYQNNSTLQHSMNIAAFIKFYFGNYQLKNDQSLFFLKEMTHSTKHFASLTCLRLLELNICMYMCMHAI